MDYPYPALLSLLVAAVLYISLLPCIATANGLKSSDFPAALRIRPPPMTADPIAPECYNFTYGNWRKQEFYSPNYPGEYINNSDCVQYLEAPPGFRIQLDFRDQFFLEKSDNCKYDFLEVRDGPFAYSPLIGRFCGAQFPPLIESTNRFLWMRFKSDDLLQYSGFKAIYSYHKDHTQNDGTSLSKVTSTVCRIAVKLGPNKPDGVLTSQDVPFGDTLDPTYPRHRPVDCTWEIFTDQGNAINLRTLKIKRWNAANCDVNNVTFYKGTTLEKDRSVRLCADGHQEMTSLTSERNRVFVRLYGSTLDNKPELEMVYSLVKTGDGCVEGYFSCGDFCIASDMRCNGIANCPDNRDEKDCSRQNQRGNKGDRGHSEDKDDDGAYDSVFGEEGDDVADVDKSTDGKDSDAATDSSSEAKIPLHIIIVGAIGGFLLTCVVFGLCIMCRSRRKMAEKKKEEQKLKERNQRNALEMAVSSSSHTTHSLSRQNGGDGGKDGGKQVLKGQGQIQGRYLTFAQVTGNPKDNTHRYSLTSSNPQSPETETSDQMSDSGHYRRYITMEVTPDDIDESSPCPSIYSQGTVIGMTHIPSPTSTGPHSPVEGSGYSIKYPPGGNQWNRGILEDPSMTYPYTASLTRPTPFLGLSKPFQPSAESKYLKSMQALKTMDEEIMRENPTT